MPDNIALQVQQPDALTSIGKMLNIGSTVQNIQRGGVELEKEQMGLSERKAVQSFLKDTRNYKNADGQVDFERLQDGITSIAPTTGQKYLSEIAAAHQAGAQAQQSLNTLTDQGRDITGKYVLSLRGMPHEAVVKNMNAFANANPNLKSFVDFALKHHIQPHDKDENRLDAEILRVGQGAMAPGAQIEAQTPSYTSTGGELKQTKPLAAVAGAPASLPVTIGPGQTESMAGDVVGNQAIVTKNPQGQIVGSRSMSGAPPNWSLPPGDREAIPVLQKERDEARTVLMAAPLAHATNRGVLHEIDHVAATGAAGPTFQKMNSLMGGVLDFSSPEKKASSYDLVGKYLERNALNAAASMGPQTNAYLEAQVKANGSLGYNPTAIKKITKLNDAIVSGSEAYQPGLEKAIAASGGKGVLAKREFDQEWAKNFDPLVMQLHNAQKDGDKGEIADIIKSIGGATSDKAKDLVRRARNIEKLSTTGGL